MNRSRSEGWKEESGAERSATGVATSSAHSTQVQIIRDSSADI